MSAYVWTHASFFLGLLAIVAVVVLVAAEIVWAIRRRRQHAAALSAAENARRLQDWARANSPSVKREELRQHSNRAHFPIGRDPMNALPQNILLPLEKRA